MKPGLERPGPAGRARLRLAAEAALRLALARSALRVLAFETIVRRLGSFSSAGETGGPGPEPDAVTAREVAWAIRAAARRMPFEATCLPQAIAAQAMLRSRGVAACVHFGAGLAGTGQLEAHAWVDAAGVGVTGHPVPPQLREFGCFVSPSRARPGAVV